MRWRERGINNLFVSGEVWGVDWIHLVWVGVGIKKARGSISMYYIDVYSKSIANIQYRISKQLDTGFIGAYRQRVDIRFHSQTEHLSKIQLIWRCITSCRHGIYTHNKVVGNYRINQISSFT